MGCKRGFPSGVARALRKIGLPWIVHSLGGRKKKGAPFVRDLPWEAASESSKFLEAGRTCDLA